MIRRANERGTANFGWLNSRHTFSFGHYHDPAFMGFGSLRVINEDRVQPGRGFDTHGHSNMEIISYVLDGALEHKDSLGTGSVIRPGDVQRMTAGTGVRHSEFNASETDSVHFLQIWVIPERDGLEPGYEQTSFSNQDKLGVFRLIGSQDGRDGSVRIHQDINLYATVLQTDTSVKKQLRTDRRYWLQLLRGEVRANGEVLNSGDGFALHNEESLEITASVDSEFLLFEMSE